jgi:arylformamidase
VQELIDLTMPLSEKTIPVPGHPSPRLEPLTTLERDGVRNTTLSFSIHTGTHVDAPSHFIPDGASIDQIPVERFLRPGLRLDLTSTAAPSRPVTLEQLRKAGFDAERARGKIVMLATGWAEHAMETPDLYENNPFLAEDAARALAAAAPSALGLDFAVDDAKPWPNHTILLGADVLLIENLVGLPGLPHDDFDVFAWPLRIAAANGGPARVRARLRS